MKTNRKVTPLSKKFKEDSPGNGIAADEASFETNYSPAPDEIYEENPEELNNAPEVVTAPKLYQTKRCRIISYNKYSGIIVFDFDGKQIQSKISDEANIQNGYVTVVYYYDKALNFKL